MKNKKEKENLATTEYSFAETQWDVEGWEKQTEKISDLAKDFEAGRGTLERYDLPRDLATLKGYGEYSDPSKWTRYILSLYQSYVGKLGYIPKPEKNRIREEYLKVAQETAPFIAGIARAVAAGCPLIVDEEGYVEVDEERMTKEAEPKFLRKIDVKRMSSYWEHIVASAQAIKSLRQFEENNSLPPSTNFVKFATEPIARQMIGGNIPLDAKTFEKSMWRNFVTR